MSKATDSFSDHLNRLVGTEMFRARNNSQHQAKIIERLATILGVTIATISRGDSGKINELVEAASVCLLEQAASTSFLVNAMMKNAPEQKRWP